MGYYESSLAPSSLLPEVGERANAALNATKTRKYPDLENKDIVKYLANIDWMKNE